MLFKLNNIFDKFKCIHQHWVVDCTILQNILEMDSFFINVKTLCILDPLKASTTTC